MSGSYGDVFAEIDFDSKDVFETSDHEDSLSLIPLEETFSGRSSIEETEFSSSNARAVFENEIVDSANADFSGAVVNGGVGSRGNISFKVPETIEQKFVRLQREFEELKLAKLNDQRECLNPAIKDDDVDNFLKMLENLNSNKFFEIQSDSTALSKLKDELKIDLTPYPVKIANESTITSDQIAGLDSRLAKLESILGYSESTEAQNFTIQSMINDLYRQVSIMSNPDFIKNDVEPLIESLERAKKFNNDSSERMNRMAFLQKKNPYTLENDESNNTSIIESKKIHAIYEKLVSLPNFEELLPSVINRLKSLNKLHLQIGSSVDFVDNLDNRLTGLETSIKEWDETLDHMETKFNEYQKLSNNNKQEIKAWIDDLDKKIEKIND
ncbi:hypothetical protein PACTADRAFT_34817 [Pachysolen tannophilus NRRL Y-2460]|uniref:Dynactin subunit 2 n=1 Tax=Pachysolen tannophilus NRRL Y-2460 TaxID=669874 RepID=A0A1E4TTK0_PACTA|nr:hypothetical protein PACTADRAFT_34817 [Pachysolen tannophilus NRRL Y-2460]